MLYRNQVKRIYLQNICKTQKKIRKQYFLDTTVFPATDLINYAKMTSPLAFFVFAATFCIGFMQTEEKYPKMIDDDVYNRITEIKAQNEIIEMNKNYSNIGKKYGELNTFMSIMLVTKITLDM